MKIKKHVKAIGKRQFYLSLIQGSNGYYYLMTEVGDYTFNSESIPTLEQGLEKFEQILPILENLLVN